MFVTLLQLAGIGLGGRFDALSRSIERQAAQAGQRARRLALALALAAAAGILALLAFLLVLAVVFRTLAEAWGSEAAFAVLIAGLALLAAIAGLLATRVARPARPVPTAPMPSPERGTTLGTLAGAALLGFLLTRARR